MTAYKTVSFGREIVTLSLRTIVLRYLDKHLLLPESIVTVATIIRTRAKRGTTSSILQALSVSTPKADLALLDPEKSWSSRQATQQAHSRPRL